MIEIHNLHKVAGQHTALEIEHFSVGAGDIAAVTGPAGSGKEVLFELLTGRTRPSAGTVSLAGLNLAERQHPQEHSEFSRRVGVLFADDALYKHLSPLDNLLLHCQFHGLGKERALEVLKLVGMADQGRARLEKLPTGLQRRVSFGRAVLHRPQVLLLYEPFDRCDESTIALLSSLVTRLAEDGAAVLILASSPAHLTGLCDTIYSLNQGKLSAADAALDGRAAPTPFKIPVRLEDKVVLVNPADILFAEAVGGHACLHTVSGSLATQFTLGELEERLARSGFFRAHRAYLVNLQHIIEVIPFTRSSYSIRLDDSARTLIPLSRAAAGELRDLLGY